MPSSGAVALCVRPIVPARLLPLLWSSARRLRAPGAALCLGCALLLAAGAALATASAQPPDPDAVLDPLAVSGIRIEGGSSADFARFRLLAAEGEMPRTDGLTIAGLLAPYQLDLALTRACGDGLCLDAEVYEQGLPTHAEDRWFVGVGLSSAPAPEAPPLHLVVVLDHSGSMAGDPLKLAQQALRAVVDRLRPGDRFSLVLVGAAASLRLSALPMPAGRAEAQAVIAAVESSGATPLSAGLSFGIAQAQMLQEGFAGPTRLLLLTDAQPELNERDAEGFLRLTRESARAGLGLTLVELGGYRSSPPFAEAVAGVRDANGYALPDRAAVAAVFDQPLTAWASATAHDLRLWCRPVRGWAITGVYATGAWQVESERDAQVRVQVPSVFQLSTRGQLFISLARTRTPDTASRAARPQRRGEPLLELQLQALYALEDRRISDRLVVEPTDMPASEGLRLAHALVDEWLVLTDAADAYHVRGQPRQAFRQLTALKRRIRDSALPALAAELELVEALSNKAALMSSHPGDVSEELAAAALSGDWRVERVDGHAPFNAGEIWSLYANTLERWDASGADSLLRSQPFRYDGRQFILPVSHWKFRSRYRGNQLRLHSVERNVRILLRRRVQP